MMNAGHEPDSSRDPTPDEPLDARTPDPDAGDTPPSADGQPARISHDQNFKNLILAYPREALAFFLPEEGFTLDGNFTVRTVRQELPKRRLTDRFYEMDTPLRVSWPNGEREDMVVLFEEESVASRFSPLRLLHYTSGLALQEKTRRIAVVVIFLRRGRISGEFRLETERDWTVRFRYRTVELPRLNAADFALHDNVLARILSVCMSYPSDSPSRVYVYAQAVSGLLQLEPDPEKQNTFIDFIGSYLKLSNDEFCLYRQLYPSERTHMVGLTDHIRKEVRLELLQELRPELARDLEQKFLQEGMRQILTELLVARFGPLDESVSARLAAASQDTLRHWTLRVVSAQSLDEVFQLQ